MGVGPPGVGLQEQALNHLKQRWLKARVPGFKEKSRQRSWQARIREMRASEPLMRCRKLIDSVKTGGLPKLWIRSGGHLFAA
jgi:hypothetical protein